MWPSKHANILRKNVTSEPHSSWSKIPCVVKRRFIPTFAEAELEAADLSGQSTDTSEFAPTPKRKKTNPPKGSKNRFDFNYLVGGKYAKT